MRIADRSKFNIYFSLSLENITIRRSDVDKSLLTMDEEQLRDYLAILTKEGYMQSYLKEVEYHASRVPANRVPLLISVLSFGQGHIDKNEELLQANDMVLCSAAIRRLFLQIEDYDQRYKLIESIIRHTNEDSFAAITRFVDSVDRNCEELKLFPSCQLVSDADRMHLCKVYIEDLMVVLGKRSLLELEEIWRSGFGKKRTRIPIVTISKSHVQRMGLHWAFWLSLCANIEIRMVAMLYLILKMSLTKTICQKVTQSLL